MHSAIVYDLHDEEWEFLAAAIEGEHRYLMTWIDDDGMIYVRTADSYAELMWNAI
jgi:hypothetical protein